MMRLKPWFASFLVALLCMASCVSLAETKEAAAIRGRYSEGARLFKARDVAGLMRMASKEIISIRSDGRAWNYKQLQAYLNLTIGALARIDSAQFRIISIEPDRKGHLWAHVERTVKGAMGSQTGKPSPLLQVSEQKDEWVRSGGKWLILHNECLKETLTVNGKVVSVPVRKK